MLNRIIEFSVKNKLIIALFTLTLIGFGTYNVSKLPIDAVPDITNNQVQVITIAPSFGATDIERLVTFPIEQANNNIPGLKEIRSFSRFGLSLVTLVFEDNVDVYWARQQVSERLVTVQPQLPSGMGTPELGPVSSGLGEIYQYVVRPEKGYENRYDATELRTIQDWVIKRQLSGVKGVAEVSSFGGKLKQIEISLSPDRLNASGVTISDVYDALEKNNGNTGGSYIEKESSVLFIRSEGLLKSKEDIENIPVKTASSGIPLLIKDIAEVKTGFATRYGAMCYNDKGEVSGAVVMMLKGANSNEVIKNIKTRIAQIQKTLPKGVVIEPFLDRTKMVTNAIGTVEKNLLEGALIVVFVLVLFLGNMRAGLLVASVIPLSMMFAVIMMNLFGVSGNLMSLGALDFGLIVDGAVIIVEAVVHQIFSHHKNENAFELSQENVDHEVKTSAKKMMNSAVFGQIIILIVYLPIFSLEGIEGKMFKPMAQTVAFALIGAFILSLTYVPMMSTLVLKNLKHNPASFSERMMLYFEKIYKMRLEQALHHKKKVITVTLISFVIAVFVLTQLGGEFIPALEEGDFAVDTRVLTGSNLNTTMASTQKAAGILKARFPEVEKVVTKIGSGEVPTDPMPMEASDMMVILKDKSEWTSATTFDELAAKMSEALKDVPGITAGFQYPVQMRFNELMTGARQDVVCKIFGENLDTLAHYAEKLGKVVNTIKGTKDLYVEPIGGMPQVVINLNRKTIAQYQLQANEINKIINASFAGQAAGQLFEEERRFDVVVRLNSDAKKNLEDIRNLLIPTPNGVQVPLYLLADVNIVNGPNQIQREDTKRRIVVGFNAERDVQSLVEELNQKVAAQIKLPEGYYITYGGSFENLNQAKQRLLIAVPISLALIFLLLYFAFKSVKQALLIYTAIPLSAIGGILFLALRGMPFSISAGIGFIALFGVAVLNGIVLIAELNMQKNSGLKDIHRVVMNATQKRLRPILMTALVASLGFLPMAISNGAGAEVQRPLATVVIGGLLIATFLTLIVLPVMYVLTESNSFRFTMKKNKISTLLVLLLSVSGFSQQTISLQQALDRGIEKNFALKEEEKKAEAAKQLIHSANEIPVLNLTAEAGQLNSSFTDNRFGLTQNLSFPIVNSQLKKVFEGGAAVAQTEYKLSENQLKKEITSVFYELRLVLEKEKLVVQTDSVYQQFLASAQERFRRGETGTLEKSTAYLNHAKLQTTLNQLRAEKQKLVRYFAFLMQSEILLMPENGALKISAAIPSEFKEKNLLFDLCAQEKQKNTAQIQLEKAKCFPEISMGVFSTTMKGTGADDKLYNGSQRFNSFQLGLGIPFFNGASKARRAALAIENEALDFRLQSIQNKLQQDYEAIVFAHESNRLLLDEYENQTLRESVSLAQTATLQLRNGEINVLDWAMITNQALETRLSYLEAIRTYNQNLIQVLYYN